MLWEDAKIKLYHIACVIRCNVKLQLPFYLVINKIHRGVIIPVHIEPMMSYQLFGNLYFPFCEIIPVNKMKMYSKPNYTANSYNANLCSVEKVWPNFHKLKAFNGMHCRK